MRCIWLASYPKSGNTYLRFLLYHYLFDRMESTRQLKERIPDIHQMAADGVAFNPDGAGDLLIKTHFLFSDRHPYADLSATFIYIIRNPRDVILSNSRYTGAGGGPDVDRRNFVLRFIRDRGVERWRDIGFGTWPGHVASWLQASESMPHLFIRYEDLITDTPAVLTRALTFLGCQIDTEKIAMAVAASSKDAMRKMEQRERTQEDGPGVFAGQAEGNEFVGQGATGQSFSFLGDDIEELYQNTFARTAALFGYA